MFNKLISFFKTKSLPLVGMFGFGDTKWAYNFNRQKSLSLYEKSLYVNKAISKRADKVGQVKFVLKGKNGKEVEWNQWLQLLDKPNEFQSGDQFWRLAQKYLDIVGACYILKKNGSGGIFGTKQIPTSLEHLRADNVEVLLNQEGNQILGFNYYNGLTPTKYTTDEVIYLYNPDPRNPLLGESLIASGIRSIETEVAIGEYHANVLKNGGKIESVFKVKDAVNGDTITSLQEQYEEKYAEAKKYGRPLFLGGDIDIQQTALSPKELSFLDTKVSTLNDIVIMSGVPTAVMGLTTDATFANADASIRIFLRETIKPLIENLVNTLNWRLIPDEFELEFIDPTPEDKADKRLEIATAVSSYSFTTNEIREMQGKDPVKNGEEIMIPFNLMPLGQPSTKTQAPVQDPNAKTVRSYHPLTNPVFRKSYATKKDRELRIYESKMYKAVREYFDNQYVRLLMNMGETKKVKTVIDDAFNTTLEISMAKSNLLPILRQIYLESGQSTANTFDLPEFNMSSAIELSLDRRAELFSTSIINTTKDQLKEVFAVSIASGDNRQDLVSRIGDLYKDISKGRAEVIARTEVHSAMQDANLQAYANGGIDTKIWVTVGDDRVRPEHEAIDGEEVPIHAVFSNGLLAPSEPNCRCTI